MFGQATSAATVRAAAVLTALGYATLGRVPTPQSAAQFFVLTTTGWTVGAVTVQLQGSNDGITYTDAGNAFDLSITATGVRYVPLTGALAPYLRLALTPAGGFDGVLAVEYRASGGPLPTL